MSSLEEKTQPKVEEQKPSETKAEANINKLNIILSRLDKATTASDIESLLNKNNYNFQNVTMMACSEAQKIFGVNPSTGFSKSMEKEVGGKKYYEFDPDYSFAKITFEIDLNLSRSRVREGS